MTFLRARFNVGRIAAAILFPLLYSIPTSAQNPPVTVNVDAAANRRPINPNVYGVAHATTAQLNDLNSPLNRNGGNNTTRYNWQLNADNRGNDWYYQSIADGSSTAGERGDSVIAGARAAGARAMLTIPTIQWVAKVGPGRSKLASFSIAKYGAQTGNDWQWFPDAGNGVRTNGQFVTGNDPNDASVPSNASFQRGWVQHLVGRWGTNANGGLRYYILDNEPSIWHATHRDVHPAGATMDEVRDRMIEYGTMIKPSMRRRWSSGPKSGDGADISSAVSISSTAAFTAGVSCPTAATTAAQTTCHGCSMSCAGTTLRRGFAPSTSSRSTTTRRATNSAMTFPRRHSSGATARHDRCGIPLTSMNRGSTIVFSSSRGCATG